MTFQQLQARFDYLGTILKLSRGLGYFNDGQRTCLCMERSAIFTAQDKITYAHDETATPKYQIPQHLEAKCQRIIKDFKE